MLDILIVSLNYFSSISYSNIFDDLLVILMIYSFIKILLISSVSELI